MGKKDIIKQNQIDPRKIAEVILGGRVDGDIPKEGLSGFNKDYKAEIAKVAPESLVQQLEIVDPITKKTTTYLLNRGGTRDQQVAMVLANPNSTSEQKSSIISAWLFEQGKESSSFILDVIASKGTAVRELRQFTSRIQYDWTYFIGMFTSFLFDQATTILHTVLPGVDIYNAEHDALTFMMKQKEEDKTPSLHDWAVERYHQVANDAVNMTDHEIRLSIMLLEMGVRFASEAHSMKEAMKEMVAEREKAAGKPFPD